MTTSPLILAHPDAPAEADIIRVLDLFAGVGGLSTGILLGDARFRVVMAVESEPRAAEGYRLNHAVADVHALPIQDWLSAVQTPGVDVVIGGPPCQGFSNLGKRDADDPRNSLWQYYARAVRKAHPSYFVLENVPQFLRSPQFELFEGMTHAGGPLAEYTFQYRVLNSMHYGAAQNRRRAIVVGHRRDLPFPGFPAITHPDREDWVTVEQAIGGLGPASPLPEGRERRTDGKSFAGPYRADELHVTRHYSELSLRRFEKIPAGGNRFNLPENLKCEAWKGHHSGSGDVMGRLRWNEPSVTIRTEFTKPEKGRYLHPDPRELRAITPFEGALLQGFPPEYRFVGPITEIVKQIGNAVPIPLGKAIGGTLGRAWDRQGREAERKPREELPISVARRSGPTP